MLRPHDPSDYADDPVVRQTIARLRLSVVAVVAGIAVTIVLGGLAANLAFRDGYRAAGGERAAPAANAAGAAAAKTSRTPAAPTRTPAVKQSRAAAQPTTATNPSKPPSATGSPTVGTLVIVLGGFSLVGFLMFLIVRRPYSSARTHAAELVRAYRTLQRNTLETFAALNATVEAKDRYTAGHGLRVTLISLLIGQELGLDEVEIDALRHAATFHDIGKIAVPDDVLRKTGVLSDADFDAMKVHPVESARICSKVEVLRPSVPAIRSHHERWDGAGYPDSLAADAIPMGARIIAVADTWDAITSDRPYRLGQPAIVALDEIRRVSGSQFDPRVVRAFLEVLAKDPWMFGLTPEDVVRQPSPRVRLRHRPRSEADEATAALAARVVEPVITSLADLGDVEAFEQAQLASDDELMLQELLDRYGGAGSDADAA